MFDLIKLFLIFLFILFLLKRKINIGYSLIAGSFLFFVLYKFEFSNVPAQIFKGIISHTSINLLLSLTLIRSFEYSLRKNGLMEKMTEASKILLSNKKLSVISMPLIIGMLPSLGGAYLSAPMVDSATKNTNISREDKAFINYWFRHPWELILPLYPGLILASTLSGIPLGNLILLNLPVSIIFFISGFLYMGNLEDNNNEIRRGGTILIEKLKNLKYFIPILMILIPVILFKLDLYIALILSILFLSVYFKNNVRELLLTIRYGITKDVFILVIGVMLFKEMLQVSGAVYGIANAINQLNIPYLLVFISLPFITGTITGISVGFVGSTFPILLNLKVVLPVEVSIAFIAGYIGVLISPLHLCLILTKNYFKADFFGIYKRISLVTVLVLFIALIEFVILRYYI